jgi:cytosine/adenosine deaminase-related metal-dependent hydrolase
MHSLLTLLPLALASGTPTEAGDGRDIVALRAGTVLVVKDGVELEDGATVLLRGSKIAAVGKDLLIPPDATIVDYGPDAVICPGFVLADSNLLGSTASPRTAEPALSAVQAFDPYARYDWALAAGITSAYVTPARMRLIAGQGAIVKLAGGPNVDRFVRTPVAVHASLSAEARRARVLGTAGAADQRCRSGRRAEAVAALADRCERRPAGTARRRAQSRTGRRFRPVRGARSRRARAAARAVAGGRGRRGGDPRGARVGRRLRLEPRHQRGDLRGRCR